MGKGGGNFVFLRHLDGSMRGDNWQAGRSEVCSRKSEFGAGGCDERLKIRESALLVGGIVQTDGNLGSEEKDSGAVRVVRCICKINPVNSWYWVAFQAFFLLSRRSGVFIL